MATLQSLQTAIDAGTIVERTGRISTGYSVKDLIYREGKDYVWAQFDTRQEKPGVAGFDSFQKVVDTDHVNYGDGKNHWVQTKKEVPHSPGNKFFYLWLTTWCEQWRKENALPA